MAVAIYPPKGRLLACLKWVAHFGIEGLADLTRAQRDAFVNKGEIPARPQREPLCIRAMRCYCAGHANEVPFDQPCDTREVRA